LFLWIFETTQALNNRIYFKGFIVKSGKLFTILLLKQTNKQIKRKYLILTKKQINQ